MKIITILIFLLFGIQVAVSLETGQQIFYDKIKTLNVSIVDNYLASPVLQLNGRDKLNINFDLIGFEPEYLKYRVIHCNSNWETSRLLENEYLKGFNEIEIDDYAYSSNTFIHYINYNIIFPDSKINIIQSGNYLLQVFPENDPDNIYLQVRFHVSENTSTVSGGFTSKTDRGTDAEFQQLFFNVNLPDGVDINPFQDIVATITQNNRPETSRNINAPLKVFGKTLIYEHLPQLIFEAGNEYRRFETVRTDYPGMHVDSVKFKENIWNAWLTEDHSRKDRPYTYDQTQKGRFKIDDYNASDPDLAADYILVHFTLEPDSFIGGRVYVDGDFTNHNFTEWNEMKYDVRANKYHLSLPLKQGSYNYQYVVKTDSSSKYDNSVIEGNKYETQNEYLINIYLRMPGSRGDRLLGSFTIQ